VPISIPTGFARTRWADLLKPAPTKDQKPPNTNSANSTTNHQLQNTINNLSSRITKMEALLETISKSLNIKITDNSTDPIQTTHNPNNNISENSPIPMQQDQPKSPPVQNILQSNPATILEEIFQSNLSLEATTKQLTNLIINIHNEAADKVNQLEESLRDMALTMNRIQKKIESDAESNATKDLNYPNK
jgi:hypothetical protein